MTQAPHASRSATPDPASAPHVLPPRHGPDLTTPEPNKSHFQIGLITLVGLSAKNSVLIVEFAARRQRAGATAAEAALTALRLRFRPIVMTSLAFILGCLPLAFSAGAGAGARRSIGTGVIGGMLGATVLALFLVPAFYRMIAGRYAQTRVPPVFEPELGSGKQSG